MLDLATIEADRLTRIAHWRAKGVYTDWTFADAFAEAAAQHGDDLVVYHSKARPAAMTLREFDDAARSRRSSSACSSDPGFAWAVKFLSAHPRPAT